MATKNASYRDGFDDGYKCGIRDGYHNALTRVPEVQRNDYSLTPHDLDTIALGIALVVLHADSIQTITATMDTQQKLGVANRVLGWLHLTSTTGVQLCQDIALPKEMPHPWLNPYGPPETDDSQREPRLRDWEQADNGRTVEEGNDDIPF